VNPSRRRVSILVALVIWCGTALAEKPKVEFWGRIAPQFLFTVYPDNSLFRPLIGPTGEDLNLDARTGMRVDQKRWNFEIDHQFIALWGDTIEATRQIPGSQLFARLPTDERRLFDLTHVFTDEGNFAALQRLDRLAVKHTTDKTVVRFGRQAITWGNGLIYNVVDIFNPFDPAAVDKEFKTGDDMLYGQVLRSSGDDVQGVLVFRRSLVTGDVEAEDSSLAFKYHGLTGQGEYDVLWATRKTSVVSWNTSTTDSASPAVVTLRSVLPGTPSWSGASRVASCSPWERTTWRPAPWSRSPRFFWSRRTCSSTSAIRAVSSSS
jgi:hypothetical protein